MYIMDLENAPTYNGLLNSLELKDELIVAGYFTFPSILPYVPSVWCPIFANCALGGEGRDIGRMQFTVLLRNNTLIDVINFRGSLEGILPQGIEAAGCRIL